MKRQTVNSMTAPQLTKVVASVISSKRYVLTSRSAQGSSGDTVYNIRNPYNGFSVDFCNKVSAAGKDYVNWARVYGTEEAVDKFLLAIEYSPKEVVVETNLNFNF